MRSASADMVDRGRARGRARSILWDGKKKARVENYDVSEFSRGRRGTITLRDIFEDLRFDT